MKHATIKDDVLIKREKEQDKLRIGGGSWSINLDQLPVSVKSFEYVTSKYTYKIAIEDAYDHGFIRILGGEKKLIVPIKHWSKT